MQRTLLKCLSAFCFAGALVAGPALAEPEADETAEEEQGPSGEDFAKSFLGKSYSGDLVVEGWTDFGGGLVSPPIYVRQYGREDGTSLVVTSKEVAPATRTSPASFVVTDARFISKPWKGYAVSIACMQGDDFMLSIVGEARGREDQEWWTEVRRAWEIALEPEPDPEAEPDAKPEAEAEPPPKPGTMTKAGTKGVKCTNPNW